MAPPDFADCKANSRFSGDLGCHNATNGDKEIYEGNRAASLYTSFEAETQLLSPPAGTSPPAPRWRHRKKHRLLNICD